MKTRVVAYCRVSTDKEDQQNSFESQKRYFEEYIKANENWDFIDIYADEGISGTSVEKREDFKRMIEDAKDRKFDLVLTKEIARFARNTKDSLEYTRKLKKMGIGVFFTIDNINTLDTDGELRLTIMSALAQDESRRTSERVKWGQKRRMEQGVVFGREVFGYYLEKGVLTVNPEEAEIVKLIFHKYFTEGKGTHTIAKELYEQGIATKRKNIRWSNAMILKMLRNEKYVGDLAQKKTYTPDFLDHKKKYNKGEEEIVYIKDHHEAIIDRDTWNAAQEELNKRTTSIEQKSKYSNRYWCSGKIICGECKSRFVSRTKKLKNGQKYKAWRCIEAANHGSLKNDTQGIQIGCNNGSINHIVLGMIVNFVLQSINTNKEQIIAELLQEIKKLNKPQKIRSTEPLKNKLTVLNSKKQKVIDSMIDGIISKDDVVLMNKKYDAEIDAIKAEIKNIEQVNLLNGKQADNLQIYVDRIKSIMNEMDRTDIEEVYKKMVNKIYMFKENILEIYLTCIPTPVKLRFSSSGKNGNYRIDCEFIE
ncbi:recombinase family protein [Acetivibrio cellulolyticus]|uniref:recombinase family protein n=1 Tax=Acetivibrio cellulolyticus TaxID=35830 RepID=UPI0001E2CBF2|nr:recombinase family protein [Acetivibrio cellulolyticus]